VSVAEVRAALAEVAELTRTAGELAALARERIDAAVRVLAELSRQHPESLVPKGLAGAVDELDRGHGHLATALTAVGDLDARL